MIRFLIADDEKYVRDSIREVIETTFKEKEEQIEIGEARNGREAIEVSERLRPDIVIIDIKMPGIDGLKAIQEIRNFLPYAYFMILTAYDYFDYAVEAVRNNVKEYILKPFDRTELRNKIMDAVEHVQSEKEKRKREIEYQEKIYNLIPVMENELSYSIVNDMLEVIDVEMYMDYLNIYFKNSFCMVVKLKEKDSNGTIYVTEGLKAQIGEHIKLFLNQRYKAIGSYRFTKDLIYFIERPLSNDTEETKLNVINLALDVKSEVKRFFGISVKIGLGRCYDGIHLMHESYQEAREALEYSSENVSVVHYEDVEHLIEQDQFLDDRFKNGSGEKFALFKAVEQYITDNLREDINLKDTAAKFNFSPYYFSRTFKKVFGYNFSDYLNLIRINKAKELLKDDSLSVKEICYLVGYNDPNYFSKVFKKYEGVTPTEYREKLR
ncbi:two-component system response regulator YesN [Caldicoprobacter guelmensis]|uniref:helix-turn-helix domain-containing protein n=1 Tax=Caldicoprobacter guelmensis TaxID=1170224 RepID=UPI0019567746|nr:helix-turn-helix domain-containing protein [Caldicoprobacter guelmensis]MBM7582179.1 two-component system response regulator YesN [Caldicoprobacter guelmensis]